MNKFRLLVPDILPRVEMATAAHAIEAHVTEAHVTEAHVTEAHVTEAHVTEAHVTEAHVTEAHETCTASSDWVNSHYTYTYNKNVATPFLKHLNDKHKPSKEWNSKLTQFANNAVSKVLVVAQEDHIWIVKKFASLIGVIKDDFLAFVHEEKIRADHLMDYAITFLDSSATAPVDEPQMETVIISTKHLDNSKTAITDAFFAEYRVTGPNPIAIKLCTAQILEKLELQDCPAMVALMEMNKLFVVDYSNFADQPPGEPFLIFSSPPKYTYGSIAQFKEKEASIAGDPNYQWTHLTPVCIQISGNKRSTRVFSPAAYGNEDNEVKWKIAKCIFQSNDGVYHEAFSHLGGTHLVAEIFMVATYRRFPEGHPLFVLLDKHFEGTAFINSVAVDELISDGGTVDLLVTPAITSVRKLVADYVAEFTSHDMTFPARIKARHTDKETVPHLNYPYRDDGMLLWDAILKWANGYLQVYYKSHQQVLFYINFIVNSTSSSLMTMENNAYSKTSHLQMIKYQYSRPRMSLMMIDRNKIMQTLTNTE